jgi:hypothetical protein
LGVDALLSNSVGGEGGLLDDSGACWGEVEDGEGDFEEGGGGGVLVDIGS